MNKVAKQQALIDILKHDPKDKKYKLKDKLKVKILEIKKDSQKVRVGLKQTMKDPFDYFKDKKINDTITVKVISSDNKGLTVQPEGSDITLVIKKSQTRLEL